MDMQTQVVSEEAIPTLIAEIIRSEAIDAGVTVEKIVLFGSRARGDADAQSDWDVLVVLRDPISHRERIALSTRLNRALARRLIPCDLLIRSCQEVQKQAHQIGSIIRTALAEGISL